MQNYLIVLSYDGTDYHGWQRQPGKRTIQGTVQSALARLAGTEVGIIGAGRTDAGKTARDGGPTVTRVRRPVELK